MKPHVIVIATGVENLDVSLHFYLGGWVFTYIYQQKPEIPPGNRAFALLPFGADPLRYIYSGSILCSAFCAGIV
ncbi:hypothetical protein [Castellaniella sp.]|uniref:hypothetical protein n=1 Tax=Castellaniella sp. TaxID=1955812 RepID=UPI003A956A22